MRNHIGRREFVSLLTGAAAAWPLAAGAQQPVMPVVAYFNSKTRAGSAYQVAAFRQGLGEAGFVEGRNVAIEFHFAESQLDRLPAMAAEVARQRVAVIFTEAATTPAAMAATSTIPIVVVSGPDPVAAGFVHSLNRPGGNVTGVDMTTTPLDQKRLELLHELVATPAVIGVLMDDASTLQPEANQRAIEAAAGALGRHILIVKARTESEIDAGFTTLVQAGARALFVGGGPFYVSGANNWLRSRPIMLSRQAISCANSLRLAV